MCAVEHSLMCLEDNNVVDEATTNWTSVREDDDDVDTGRGSCRRAFQCRTLVTDDRVLSNLLATEHNNRPSADCCCRQTEVLPYMRDTVVTWMLEVRCCAFFFNHPSCVTVSPDEKTIHCTSASL